MDAWRYPRLALSLAALALATVSLPAGAVRLRPAAPAIYAGTEEAALDAPAAVACREALLVVADTGNSRLLLYDLRGDDILPSLAWAPTGLAHPTRVQIDPKGGIWVLDGKLHRISRLGPAGEILSDLEPAEESGPFLPRSFRIGPGGDLYVLDVASARVLVLSVEGDTRRTIAFPEGLSYLSDLAVDSTGTVFAVDSVSKRVFRALGEDEALLPLSDELGGQADFPTGIAVDERGRLFVIDQNGGGIVLLGRDGSFRRRSGTYGWKPAMLRYPTDACVAGDRLFVADMGNSRVQVFQILD